jgi:hypothetical protein
LAAASEGVTLPGWLAPFGKTDGIGPLDLASAARRFPRPETAQPILADRGFRAGFARSWQRQGATLDLVTYAMGTTAQAADLLEVMGQATAADLGVAARSVPSLPGASSFSRTGSAESKASVLLAVRNVYVAVSETVDPAGPTDEVLQVAQAVAERLG